MIRRPLATLALFGLVALAAAPALAQAVVAPLPAAGAPTPERAAWFAHFQDARGGPESIETVTRTFKVGQTGSLDIFNLAGPVVVSGVPGEQIVVTAVKRVRGRPEDAKTQLEAIVIDASETGGRVEVRTVVRGRVKHMGAWVEYTVQVPFGTAVSARSLGGDVKVSKVKGEVQIESANGAVEATGTPRLVRVKTLSGDVLVADSGSAGGLSVSTVSGRLVTRGLKAPSIELATISGDLLMSNTTCDRAQVRTMSGSLEFLGPLLKGGRYEFTSHAGDVRLKLTGSPGFELFAKTFSGDVRSDLPLVVEPADKHLPPGVPERRDVRGTFGDGSALLLVKTFSGSVTVGSADAESPSKPKAGKTRKKE
jgi:DUF4097 and DUF4098 domain-containing protein YvlB